MNITALRPRLVRYIEPIATVFCKAGITPNQISLLSLFFGVLCAVSYCYQMFILGSLFLFISAVLDLVDGSVARRTEKETRFGAVFDWIADKYVDALVILGIGISGIAILSQIPVFSPGKRQRYRCHCNHRLPDEHVHQAGGLCRDGIQGPRGRKIEDPLEGVGFFGRPETILVLLLGGLTGFIWVSVIVIAVGTNLSALQRIIYLYGRLS